MLDSQPFPAPLAALKPLGSLLYSGTASGTFAAGVESDDFTITLEAGQKLTATFDPSGAARGARLRLVDPTLATVATAESPGDGAVTLLQTAPVLTAGLYRVVVEASAGSAPGGYQLNLLLNGAGEEEAVGGAANDTAGTAQSLASSSVGIAAADRLGLVGAVGAAGDSDWYSFTLTAGQHAALAVSALNGGNVDLELRDAAGALLARGVTADNADELLASFVSPTAATYYARVSGEAGKPYALVVTRGAGFEAEPNNATDTAQPLGPSRTVLGFQNPGVAAITTETEPNDNGTPGAQTTDLPLANRLSGSFVPLGGNVYRAEVTGTISAGSDADWDFFEIFAAPGDTLQIELDGVNVADPFVWLIDSNATILAGDDDAGPGLNSFINFSSFAYSGAYYVAADSFGSHTGTYRLRVTLTTPTLQQAGDHDYYTFTAAAGDVVTIETTTPGGGAGEPVNDLDPTLELYSPTGALVASNNNGAADGRNVRFTYPVPAGAGGEYRVRLTNVSGSGPYTLTVAGATPTQVTPFAVASSSIADGVTLNTTPGTLTLTFSTPVLLTSVDATDLTVNGIAVPLLEVADGRSLVFDVSAVVSAEGSYAVALPAGVISSLEGVGNSAFSSSFTLDATAPVVTESSLVTTEVVITGRLAYTARFNEDLPADGLDGDDVSLYNSTTDSFFFPDIFEYDPVTDTLRVEYSDVWEGTYEFRLLSGPGGFRDLGGNALDGEYVVSLPSGDGTPGGDFVVGFTAFITEFAPPGGMIHRGTHTAQFNAVPETHTYTIDLDPGQTLAVAVTPSDPDVVVTVTVTRPDSTTFTATAAGPGQAVIFNDVLADQPGAYTIEVTNADGAGSYDLSVSLNAVIEAESLVPGDNGTPDDAQALVAFASLTGSVSHAGAVGTITSYEDVDYYRFELTAGETVSLALGGQGGGGGEGDFGLLSFGSAALHLVDAAGEPLAIANLFPWNARAVIEDFVAPYTGTYYARVSGDEGDTYGLVVVRGAGFDREPNNQLAPFTQHLPSSGSVLGRSDPFDNDAYSFLVNAGDVLTITTTTPADGALGYDNRPVVTASLFDGDGNRVASDDNPDGGNISFSYTATASGLYTVILASPDFWSGDYVLTVTGAAGGAQPFRVDYIYPEDGLAVPFVPTTIDLTFNDGVRIDTVQASDVTVDGVPVLSFVVTGANTAYVEVPELTEGSHTVEIAASALLDWQGTPIEAFTSQFSIDLTAPRIVASSVLNGDVIASGTLVYTATFDELLDEAWVNEIALQLVGPGGANYGPSSVVFDPDTLILTVTFDDVPEGSYELTLVSSQLYDRAGNALDGEYADPLPSGDGVAGGDFVVNFMVDDMNAVLLAAPTALDPRASLVYETGAAGAFHGTGDVDVFTVNLAAGQLATLTVTSASGTVRGRVELLDPNGVVIAATDDALVLQAVAVTMAGEYRVRLTGLEAAGSYTLGVLLNAVTEVEPNDTSATAQDLGGSSLAQPAGADRLAAVGRLEAGADDYYHFSLAAGQYASVAASGQAGGAVTRLELYDATGTRVAVGLSGAPGQRVNLAIHDFLSAAGGTYFLRVGGAAGVRYAIVVTRGASFDRETNDNDAEAQFLGHTLVDVGAVAANQSTIEPDAFPNGTNLANAFPGVTLTVVGGGTVTSATSGLASTGSRVFAINGNTVWTSPSQTLQANFATPVSEVSIDVIGDDSSDPGILQAFNAVGVLIATFTTPAVGPAGVPRTMTISRPVADIAFIRASGLNGDTASLDNLRVSGDFADVYRFHAAEGSTLDVRTFTPLGSPGAPVNGLNPRVLVFNADGFLVASDDDSAPDGRNARAVFTVPAGGAGLYTVWVQSQGQTTGEYTLSVQGTPTSAGPAPAVVAATPADGQKLVAPPTSLTLTFSEGLRIDTVSASDLVIGGGASVTGVEVLDARTLRFLLDVPNAEGAYAYSLAAGAVTDLQGLGVAAFAGSFAIDNTGPRVVSQAPAVQASAPFNSLTFVFDEVIDPSSVGTADIASFTGPGGVNLLGTITGVSGSGNTITVTFTNRTTLGTYTMVIGPNINDTTGNRMNQDGDAVNGEAGDTYTATIQLQSPDLTVLSPVGVPASGVFGQSITVNWTVQNIGTDPAREAWSDRVYLSTNSTLEEGTDVLLGTFPVGANSPLINTQTYARSVNVTLPLQATLGSGNYFIIVKTDALNQQPESSEANNVRTSQVLPVNLPPLPDLVVSDIVAPIDAFAGQQVPISWTLTNIGTGPAIGTWTDQMFLSSDAFIGSDQFFGNCNFTGTIPAGGSVTRTQMITLPQNLQGFRWVVIRTDAGNAIYEHANEGNNTSIDNAAIDVRIPPLPNLQVTSVTPPPTAFSSQGTTVQWVVTNVGTGATSAPVWYDAVYLSLDRNLDPTDVFLGEAENPSYLSISEGYSNSLNVTLPRGIEGNYFFLVKTDYRSHVFEHESEGDNVGSGAATLVQLTPPPDLRVTLVNAPGNAFSGQKMNLGWTVTNSGTGRTLETSWFDEIYMSADETLVTSGENADRFLGRRFHSGALNASQFYTATQEVTLPIGVSGPFYFFVRTDVFNQVYEHASEGNNDGHDTPATNVLLTPPPDLEVLEVGVPATALASHPLTINYLVANLGASGTPNASWIDTFYLSADTTLDAGDLKLGDTTHAGSLPDNGEYQSNVTFTLPNGLQGTYYVLAHTDRTDVVFELDNVNNVGRSVATVAVSSRPADLVISASAPTEGEAGKTIRVDFTVSNVGTGDTAVTTWTDRVIASTDATLDGSDVILASFTHTGLIAAGGSYARSELVNLPITFLGTYHLFVVSDVNNNVYEATNEGNNASLGLPIAVIREVPDLQVTSVTGPSTALAATDIVVNWDVRNFGANQTNAAFWYDEVWLSADGFISADDVRLGNLRRSNALGAGALYTGSATFRLPVDRVGAFRLLVRTDHDNRVFEGAFEGNNDGASLGTITIDPNPAATARPDLEVVIVGAPTTALSGQGFSLTWEVRNRDVATTRTWYDAVYLSRDQVFDRDTDVSLGHLTHSGGLGAGASYTETRTFNIPLGLSGPFYVFVATDSGNSVDEAGRELNNVGYDSGSMLINLAPPADLVVGTITVPASAALGRTATIQYTITNQGTNPALGSWFDSIYLSADDTWDVGDALFGRVQHTGTVPGNGGSYTGGLTAAVPGVLSGEYHVIIRSDIRNAIPESNEANNLAASLDRAEIDAQRLDPGVPFTDTLANNQSAFFRIDVAAGETLVVKFDSASATASNELYVRYGDVPSRAAFDYAFTQPLSPDQQIVVPWTRGGTYYILAYGASVSGVAPQYTITASVPGFSILDVGPSEGSNRGLTTVRVNGTRFKPDAQIRLAGPGGVERVATRVWWKDSSEAWATFDLRGLAAGAYDVRVTQGAQTATSPGAFTVLDNAPAGELQVQVSAPPTLRPGQTGVVTVSYVNGGLTDIPAPVLTLAVTNALLRMPDGTTSSSIEFLGIGPSGPAGILAPGDRGTLSLVYVPTIETGDVQFSLSELAGDRPMDWSGMKESARPAGTPAAAWDLIWANFTAALGTTGAGLRAVLADNASHLSQIGIRTNDTARLLRFEMEQASGSLYQSVLVSPNSAGAAIDIAASQDSAATATELPLFLSRQVASGIEGRYRQGPLGRGWAHNWEISVEVDAAGTVTVFQGANARVFTPQPGGGYRGLPGETGVLTLTDGRFRLTETAGIALQFRTDGLIESIADRNGNVISAAYTSGRLTSLTHSDGESLTFSYTPAGLISQLVEGSGRVVTYTYDAAGERLATVTRDDGVTTYAYESTGAAVHALRSITHPDGSSLTFTYDARGLQSGHATNGGQEAMTYAFDSAGGVTRTDADGHVSRLLLTDTGATGRTTDALGNVNQLFYDERGNLIRTIAPDGATSTFTYDAAGNLIGNQNALGQSVTFTYDDFGQMRSLRDGLGRTLRYTYDTRGNAETMTYPDGSVEEYYTDPVTGLLTTSVNRRDQEIHYTYNSRGLIERKDYADGTFATFTYDARGNILTATDADSSVTYAYDASGQLRRVDYGSGSYVEFDYDTVGRRKQMTDGMAVVNYAYNAVGMLDELTDGSGARIVKYTYDARGHLAREDNGNGTATTYSYDAANRLTSVVNYDDDGTTVNSRFDYTYDAAGRRTSVTTLEGVTTFGYDAVGQLTSVTLPGGRVIEYRYDAVGNRVSVIDSGVTTGYATNNLNQYTGVGATTYTYDLDGNLASKTSGGVTWVYSYDSENRLVQAQSTAGELWQYEYDALGNRVASIRNGQRTTYLVDPTGWGDVVAEYGPAGDLLSRYTYGVGLVSRLGADGSAAYYDFDAVGNTAGLSGDGGAYVNRYGYLPFGEALEKVEGLANDFEYGGQWGVMQEGTGLSFMRARYYDPATGRFTGVDPLRVGSGDVNFYRYARNNPVSFSDPTGEIVFLPILIGAGIGAAVDLGIQLVSNGGDFGNIDWGSVAISAGVGALGGAIGAAGAGRVGMEFSHWIPARFSKVGSEFYKGLPRWLTQNTLNGNWVPRWLHAATDPWRLLKGMKKWGDHLYPPLLRQLLRLPGWLTGGGLFGPLAGWLSRLIRPSDPNDMVGPEGFGQERWVTATETLPYTIRFENQASATAPTQVIAINQILDPDLDPRSFRLGNFSFRNILFEVPANRAFHAERLDLRSTLGLFVDVVAGINVATGEAFWTLTAIDPDTGEPPVDASRGFLPPNDAERNGEGYVSYTVRPRRTAPTGAVIDAQARIVFDTEEPIDTPPIFNTIDAGMPTSAVEVLPPLVTAADNTFLVRWAGSDDATGSALAGFTIYVSDNGGDFVEWLVDTALTEASYVGVPGHTYAFFSRARDNAGNREGTPTVADALTEIGSGDTTPPEVLDVVDVAPDPRQTAVSKVEVVFSEALDLASLDEADVTLTRGGAAVPIPAGTLTFEQVAGTNRYRITGLGTLTQTDGAYVLTVNGAGVTDAAGNAGVGSASDAWLKDATAPTSHVNVLASVQTSLTFPVSVTGSDSGSGVVNYDVYVSINGSPWALWTTLPAGSPTGLYTGQDQNTYSFHSRARDALGNVEAAKTVPEATTYLPDLTAPLTQVTQVNAATPTVVLTFTGEDAGGSGLSFFDVFVQIDGGAMQQVAHLGAGSPAGGVYTRTATYSAPQDGLSHTYRFFTVGTDARGNVEAAPAADQDIVVTASFGPPAQLEVSNFDVQKGATQRSFIRYLDVTFNSTDALLAAMVDTLNDADPMNDRVRLTRYNLEGGGPGVAVPLAGRVQAIDQVMAFDFTAQGITGNRNSNAGDGYYVLEMDFTGDGTVEAVRRFYRLLGDVTGNRRVDTVAQGDGDVAAIVAALNQAGIGLEQDVNGDGVVNNQDRALATIARGRSLGAGLGLDD